MPGCTPISTPETGGALGALRALWRRWDSPWLPCGAALAFYVGIAAARLAVFDWDPSIFVCAGDHFADRHHAALRYICIGSTGFDGQFFYRLSLDPFTRVETDHGIRLDAPAYRQQRILYPLTVRVLSGGHPGKTFWTMLVVNLLALGALGWLGGRLAQAFGRHAFWGGVVAAYPGFLLSLMRDVPEPYAVMWLLAGLLALREGRFRAATLHLSLAVLTREPTAIVAAGGLAAGWVGRLRGARAAPLHCFAVPLAVGAVWQAFLYATWGVFPASYQSGVGVPGLGFAAFVLDIWKAETPAEAMWLKGVLFLTALAIVSARAFRRAPLLAHEKVAWVAYGLLAFCLSDGLWNDDWNFMRVLGEFHLSSVMILLGRGGLPMVSVFTGQAVLWGFYADRFV